MNEPRTLYVIDLSNAIIGKDSDATAVERLVGLGVLVPATVDNLDLEAAAKAMWSRVEDVIGATWESMTDAERGYFLGEAAKVLRAALGGTHE